MLKKPSNFFELKELFSDNKSERNHLACARHCFADTAFSGKFTFPICEHSVRRAWQVHLKETIRLWQGSPNFFVQGPRKLIQNMSRAGRLM